MGQRYALNRKTTVFIHYIMTGGVYRMELYFVVKSMTKSRNLQVEHLAQSFWCIHMKRSSTPKHAESREHAYQSKTVVTMYMGDKDGLQLGKPDMRPTHLHLRALTAVYHKQFTPHLNDL